MYVGTKCGFFDGQINCICGAIQFSGCKASATHILKFFENCFLNQYASHTAFSANLLFSDPIPANPSYQPLQGLFLKLKFVDSPIYKRQFAQHMGFELVIFGIRHLLHFSFLQFYAAISI